MDVDGDGIVVGEDSIVVGAPMVRSPNGGVNRRQLTVPKPSWMANATAQGVSTPKEEMDFLPFDITNLDSNEDSGQATSFPQRPFRGERLILSALYQTAAGVITDVSSAVFIVPAIFVGGVQIGATQGKTPFSAFGPQAYGVRLSWPVAGQGSRVLIPYATQLTIASGDAILIGVTCIGRAVR